MKKILLILGASSDIGLGIIEAFQSEYELIIAHYNKSYDNLSQIKESLGDKLVCIKCDFSIESEINDFVNDLVEKDIIPTHIVHLPAEKIHIKKFKSIRREDIIKELNISVFSIYTILQNILPILKKRKIQGKIVFMLSEVVEGLPPKYSLDYVMVKYTLLGLMKALAVEYASDGITINGISPSFIETRFINELQDIYIELNRKDNPLGRNLIVDDVIPSIGFLLSDGAECINGENIKITCGKK